MPPAPPALRPHQAEAVEAVVNAVVAGEQRVTVVSACGTGKTLTAAATAHRLAPQGTVLVAVPTLALLTQTVQRWRQAGRTGLILGISSLTQHRSGLTRQQAIMTNDRDHIAALIEDAHGPVTVFVTYASLPLIRRLHQDHALPAWDMAVIDEAHRTCKKAGRGWGTIHSDDALPARLRLYMTATPRIFNTPAPPGPLSALFEALPDATMDRRDIFGPVVYRLSLSEAIERGILADYRVVMPVVTDQDLHDILTDNPADSAHHNGLRTAALHVAVLRAIADHDLRRLLVFHNRIAAAHAFAAALPDTAAEAADDLHLPDLWSHAVDSLQTPAHRRRLMEDFADTPRRAVLSNVRVLNEGVDIPAIDAVVFAAARESVIDAIQAIGRALRQQPGQGKKATLVLPVYLPDTSSAHDVLRTSEFAGLWNILQALRAHDDTFLDRVAMPHSSGHATLPTRAVHYHLPERALEIALALGLEITLPPTGDWDEAHASAAGYHERYGHLDVPAGYRDEQGFALGEWISNQRLRHTAGRLDDNQRTALSALGMLWTAPGGDFTRMLAHARAWAEKHGHLGAPQHATHGGHPVGRWLAECRRKAKAGRLAADYDQALNMIDPWWNPPPGFTVLWRRYYAYAKAHIEKYGTGHVPNAYKTSDGVPLGQWINRQLNHFHELHPAQAQLLLDIQLAPAADSVYDGERGTERYRAFRNYLEAAAAYLAREGNLRVPRGHDETIWNGQRTVALGHWIHKIRKAPEKLTEGERQALERLFMVWDLQLGAKSHQVLDRGEEIRHHELSDQEWEILAPLIPVAAAIGRPRAEDRQVVNGMLYKIRTGIPWRYLPEERYGSWQTVYARFRRYAMDGVFARALQQARARARADAAGDSDWLGQFISTLVRANQHAAAAGRN
ncbi:Helicase associated domain protein [Streptomyces olivaceus]|uniref:Helicase associated domain protein n=1 Tax=Streptomyces olivaceus TaxID=47716 RepID=UPI001CCD67F0|nr:Helicase associated domain protein [Streptomyces olivaceus]MBZ6135454.1 Helicase associated domain protein [Streptomyces olivaceus]